MDCRIHMYTIGDLLPHSFAWFFFVQHHILLFQKVIKFNIDKKNHYFKGGWEDFFKFVKG